LKSSYKFIINKIVIHSLNFKKKMFFILRKSRKFFNLKLIEVESFLIIVIINL